MFHRRSQSIMIHYKGTLLLSLYLVYSTLSWLVVDGCICCYAACITQYENPPGVNTQISPQSMVYHSSSRICSVGVL
ncbi:hypothetical protein F4823DRAFT_584137 [Ustulina deusta]|nr:hypothetical protein F4823DRAFT_584137 [Ustulina deusta]